MEFSRLGLGNGGSEANAIRVVRTALDLGVNLLDTAAVYGTEEVVGQAITGLPRLQVVVATKSQAHRDGVALPALDVVASLHGSLRRLRTDYVDIFQLHGVAPSAYPHARDVILPALLREREAGRIRHIGITETAPVDPSHAMLRQAVSDTCWDTVMVAFHMLHQNARVEVFPATTAARVGTLLMFAVRRIFARPDLLAATTAELAASGQLPDTLDLSDPLGFLIHPRGAKSVTEAAYRYVRHEPGVDVVLFGTGDTAHVRDNIAALLAPPLPQADRNRIAALFGRFVGVGLDRPPARPAP